MKLSGVKPVIQQTGGLFCVPIVYGGYVRLWR